MLSATPRTAETTFSSKPPTASTLLRLNV